MDTKRVVLRIVGVGKRFGETRALEAVSLTVVAGEVHALVGENGAGKSTLARIAAGLVRQDAGTVEVDGRTLPAGSPARALEAGVRLVPQEPALCPSLSVAENVMLHALPRRAVGLDRHTLHRLAGQALRRLDADIRPDWPAGALSPGQAQIVQIAAALVGGHAAGARVIILDEPTASLTEAETQRLLAIVRHLAAGGLAVVYVSHRLAEVFACCDRISVLRDGRLAGTTRAADTTEASLIAWMVGREVAESAGRVPGGSSPGPPRLVVEDVHVLRRLHGVSLRVGAGEVVGVGGLMGAGRSTLLDALFGLRRHMHGRVRVDGCDIARRGARAAIGAGVRYVPEDRRLKGLFPALSCADNVALLDMPRLGMLGLRQRRAEAALALARCQRLRIRAASLEALPGTLSGGNQQKLLLARWLDDRCRVLLLDEPTRGIDVATKAEIHRLIRQVAASGAAVLLVSSDMPELLSLADRVVVLCRGRIAGELAGRDITQENVLRLAMGR